MRRIPGLRRLFRLPTTTARVAGEVSDEVAFHLDMQARDLEAQGMSPADAYAEAQRRFGDVGAASAELNRIDRARVRRGGLLEWWEILAKDIRYAARGLAKQPTFTAFVVATLALGIGANTAMFSIADALVLRSLPVPYAARLTLLRSGGAESRMRSWTNPLWEAIRDRPALHDGAFAFSMKGFDLSERGEADPVEGLRASGGIFRVLGVRPLIGRTFTEADDRRDGGPDGPVAVIGYGFWKRRYGGGDVVGHTIALNRIPFTIVGVTPPEFFGPEVGRNFDIAIPLNTVALVNGNTSSLDSRSEWWLQIMLRLAPGQTAEQATARLRAVQGQIREETRPANQRPENAARFLADPFRLTPAALGSSDLRDSYRKPVLILLALVALTLLIACGNIANLMLARTAARRHELSVRTALGASGGRLARQLFTESALLAIGGAALGVIVAVWSSRLIVAQLSTASDPVFLPVGLDWRMLAFTASVAAGTALLFGTVPALRASRAAPIEAMKEQGRSTSPGRRVGLAGSLVVAQVALSLVLLVAAGLFVRSFASLAAVNPGFDKDHVLFVHVGTRRAGLEAPALGIMYDRVLTDARALPGVASAALSQITPGSGSSWNELLEASDHPGMSETDRLALVNMVSPGWFATLGIPRIAGRDIDATDRLGAPRAMVVNRAFVAKYVGRGNAIGARVRLTAHQGDDTTPLEIVGVVEDAVYDSPREGAPPTMYWALAQRPTPGGLTLVVRSAGAPPASLARSVEAAALGVNPNLSFVARPLSDAIGATMTQERLVASLSGFFGVLALLLAAIGLYGVTAYAVTRRHIELGIRMALGSTSARVVRLVLGRVVLLITCGVVLGTLASWWASSFVQSLLFGLTPRDPATIVGAAVVLAGVGALAGWLPAMRASRIDPATVLREE